jgi:cholesterol oxidase
MAGFAIWPATTTLYVAIHPGDDDAAPVVGRGILRIRSVDFARQLTTLQVRNAANAVSFAQLLG